jgi:hypothetical protein
MPLSAVILDTGVLSLVVDKPGKSPTVTAVQNWLTSLLAAGVKIYVPEICDYELRRELIRAHKTSSLHRLDTLASGAEYIVITTPILHQAAQLWATARNAGTPTANDTALDGDIILCAQVLSLGIAATDYRVATTNTKHLTLFVNAAEWQAIIP